MALKKVELSQPQGNGIGFALALRAELAHRISSEHQFDIVAMHTSGSVTGSEVTLTIGIEQFEHAFAVELALVMQLHSFRTARNKGIVAVENGGKVGNPLPALCINVGSGSHHTGFDTFEEDCIGHTITQHCVAVFQGSGVTDK